MVKVTVEFDDYSFPDGDRHYETKVLEGESVILCAGHQEIRNNEDGTSGTFMFAGPSEQLCALESEVKTMLKSALSERRSDFCGKA